jgi:hypothetical protein
MSAEREVDDAAIDLGNQYRSAAIVTDGPDDGSG